MLDNSDKGLTALGKQLREAREQLGLSQVILAKKAGLSPNYYASVERGEKNISFEKLLPLLKVLNIKKLDIK